MIKTGEIDVRGRMYKTGIIAVLVVDDAKDAVPLAHALLDGGIDIMELTLRTPVAMDALREIKKHVPEMVAGVGTILNPVHVHDVVSEGAAFGMAPGMNPRVIEAALDSGLPYIPGVMTPSDIENAYDVGCVILKFFPAEASGGLKYLQSMASPYAHLHLKFIPLGGLDETNLGDYIASPIVLAAGGSWIAKRELIQKHDWKRITENARRARAIVTQIRGE